MDNNIAKCGCNCTNCPTYKENLKSIDDKLDEAKQMELGNKLARFINDIARLEGQIDYIDYKLELCEHLGLFPKFIDKENYILFSNKFGPEKFVEAFVYKIINYSPEDDYDMDFTTAGIEKDSKRKKDYNKKIGPIERAKSYYAFEFARIKEE